MPALRTGLALAATAGGFYVLCTVAWVVAPAVSREAAAAMALSAVSVIANALRLRRVRVD